MQFNITSAFNNTRNLKQNLFLCLLSSLIVSQEALRKSRPNITLKCLVVIIFLSISFSNRFLIIRFKVKYYSLLIVFELRSNPVNILKNMNMAL